MARFNIYKYNNKRATETNITLPKRANLLLELPTLHLKVRALLIDATEASLEAIKTAKPSEPKEFAAAEWANLRWGLLLGGFTHNEVSKLTKALNEAAKDAIYPSSDDEIYQFVEKVLLLPPGTNTNRYDTLLWQYESWNARVTKPALNEHETLVVALGKKLNGYVENDTPEDKEFKLQQIAIKLGVTTELLWRIMTGGRKVPGPVLDTLHKFLRNLETEMEADHE